VTDTSSLRSFIEARLAEDERAALAIKSELRIWLAVGGWPEHCPTKVVSGEVLIVDDDADMATEVMPHIARHDPARVFREVAAKRAILARHPVDPYGACEGCGYGRWDGDTPWVSDAEECPELRIVASVWSDHPDYRTEWSTA
jgi:hypothetical protein